MSWEQRWSLAEFEDVRLRPDAGSLVWGRFDGDVLVDTFRVAEDQTLADIHDDELVLDRGTDNDTVGVVHPMHLTPADVRRWAAVLADYEILQPFPQIGRPHEPLEDEHLRAGVIPIDRSASRAKLHRLYGRGWMSDPADSWPIYRIDSHRQLKLDIGPMSAPDPVLVQRLRATVRHDAGTGYDALPFAGIPRPFISDALGMVLPLLDVADG